MRAIPTAPPSLIPPAHGALSLLSGWAQPIVPKRPASRWLISVAPLGVLSVGSVWFAVHGR